MAKKDLVQFVCSECGAVSSSWSGKCYNCGNWNTLQEQTVLRSTHVSPGKKLTTQSVGAGIKSDLPRLTSAITDFDSVLGGGLVAGSVSLMAGQPGIGKSTLLLQYANSLANKYNVLYISGEELAHQISLRAKRLEANAKNLQVATSNSTDDIVNTINEGKYRMVIVDLIQTVTCSGITSSAGSISQITNSTYLLSAAAKQTDTALILIGHVTKEGNIAGPKLLEHMVDVVLQIEGDRYGGFKLLRAVKNRYGSTEEAGIFEMVDKGFKAIDNPSAALLSERQVSDGSIVLATMEGNRPLLVEVQALVNKTSYGYPKRAASGIDLNRVNLLIAMLERRTKLSLADRDVYINIVGGIRITEPAADLAICMAIASASKGMQLKADAVVFGEVGLSGEIRNVPFQDKRINEAQKLGFKTTIGPKLNNKQTSSKHIGIRDVRTALNTFLEKD